jgi:hypothetical protein
VTPLSEVLCDDDEPCLPLVEDAATEGERVNSLISEVSDAPPTASVAVASSQAHDTSEADVHS